jgi:phosphoglycolate phosphatase-like HAD superfamily hydrolase
MPDPTPAPMPPATPEATPPATPEAATREPVLHPALDGIDLVVFDKDGTLISFEAMWAGWARELGTRLELATRRPVAGDVFTTIGFDPVANRVQPGGPLAIATMAGIEELIGAVLRRWCPSVAATRRILADAWFEPDPVALAVPLADLGGLFAAIRGTGRRIAVATTDDRRPTEATFAALGLAGLVDGVLCGDDDGPTMPDPDALRELARQLGIAVGRTAMVGDTPADLAMARGAGARAIGVTSGLGGMADLHPLADAVVASVGDLGGDLLDGPGSRA